MGYKVMYPNKNDPLLAGENGTLLHCTFWYSLHVCWWLSFFLHLHSTKHPMLYCVHVPSVQLDPGAVFEIALVIVADDPGCTE